MLRGGHARAEEWRPAPNHWSCSRTVGVAEINFKIPNNSREARENQICTMDTKSESENYSLANPGEARSVAEIESKILVDGNIISGTLHYSVGMTEDGNIRVKDSYCDSEEESETYFQLLHKTTCVLKSIAATFAQLRFVRIVTTNR
jgi:hypothetical protein